MAMTHRNGKALTVLQDGHPRRLADGRNAWKKMNQAQRETFLRDVVLTDQESIDLVLSVIDENEVIHDTPGGLEHASTVGIEHFNN